MTIGGCSKWACEHTGSEFPRPIHGDGAVNANTIEATEPY